MQQTAIIAGCGSTIGGWIADTLVLRGFQVVGLSRMYNKYTSIADVDVTSFRSLADSIYSIRSSLEVADYFIYCCGVAHQSTLNSSDPDLWLNDISVNLVGAYNFYKAIAEVKSYANPARFVFLGSTSSISKGAQLSSYAISKEGLESLVRYINNEANHQWRAGCIRLGTCSTPFSKPNDNIITVNKSDIAGCVEYLLNCRLEVFPELISVRPINNRCST